MRVLDAGCGTGETLQWLAEAIEPSGKVVGIDLAEAHAAAAHRYDASNIEIMQGDLLSAPLTPPCFDFIWCVNTINHLRDPVQQPNILRRCCVQAGELRWGKVHLVPDMYFAWDSRLERLTNEAVRRYYRDRYGLEERDLAPVRAIVGVMRDGRLKNISARTVMLERVSPLDAATESLPSGRNFSRHLGRASAALSCRMKTMPNSPGSAIRAHAVSRCGVRIFIICRVSH